MYLLRVAFILYLQYKYKWHKVLITIAWRQNGHSQNITKNQNKNRNNNKNQSKNRKSLSRDCES